MERVLSVLQHVTSKFHIFRMSTLPCHMSYMFNLPINVIMHFFLDKHKWQGCTTFHACQHPEYSDEESKEIMWLLDGGMAHDALSSIIQDRTFVKALEKLSENCNTCEYKHYL